MKAIVVLGMHRSGTSAVTRALGLLGAAIGPQESTGEYWENQPMRRINEELLAALGGAWDCPPVLDDGWVGSRVARGFVSRGREVLAQEYGGTVVMVWKDPRTCLTLPFWQELFDEAAVFVLIHRHPVEVARSLLTRDALGCGHAFAMWERYNAAALKNTVGHPTVVIGFDRLIEDPTETMSAVAGALARWGVHLPNDAASTKMELDPLRRHHAAASDALDDPIATDAQRSLFALLREAGGASDRLSLPRPIPAPHPLSVELLDFAARARASSELLRTFESRRWLLRQLLNRTVVEAWDQRPRRRVDVGTETRKPADTS